MTMPRYSAIIVFTYLVLPYQHSQKNAIKLDVWLWHIEDTGFPIDP